MYALLKRLFTESFLYSVGNILGRSISLLTMPIFTRSMSVAEYGILSLVRPFGEFVRIFVEMGASASAARFYYDDEAYDYQVKLFSTLFFFIAFSALCAALVLLFFAEPLWNRFVQDVPFSPYVVVVTFSALIAAPEVLTRTLFRVRGEARRFVKLNLLFTLSVAALAIPSVIIFDLGALGPLVATLIMTCIFAVIYFHYLRPYLSFRFSVPLLRDMLVFGLPEIPVRVGNWALKTISQLILQHYSSLAAVAVFSVAFAVATILFELVVNAIHTAIQPFYYQVDKEEAPKKASEVFAYVGTLNATVILFFALLAILFGKELILILASSKYAGAGPLVTILAISAVFQFLFFIPSRVFYIEKKTGYLTPLLLLAVTINVALSFILIPPFGALGAAWANLIAFASRSVVAVSLAQRVRYIPYDYARISKALFVFSLIFAAGFLVPADSPLLVSLALKTGLISLFPALLFLTGFFQERELRRTKELLQQQLAKRLRRQ